MLFLAIWCAMIVVVMHVWEKQQLHHAVKQWESLALSRIRQEATVEMQIISNLPSERNSMYKQVKPHAINF